jgi:hypothetical protein
MTLNLEQMAVCLPPPPPQQLQLLQPLHWYQQQEHDHIQLLETQLQLLALPFVA